MSLIIEKFEAKGEKRYDLEFTLDGGIFGDDKNFKFRLLKNYDGLLSEKEVKKFAQKMVDNQSRWSEGKVWYTYNGFSKRETGYILKSSWNEG